MPLEFVDGAGPKDSTERPGVAVGLAEAERLVAGARQRLTGLADALAVLRRRVRAVQGPGHMQGDGGSPLPTPGSGSPRGP